MRTIRHNWGRLAATLAAGLGLMLVFAARLLWGQSLPALRASLTNSSQISLVVTNGTNTAQYLIYYTELLSAAPDWTLFTIGTNGQTNFTVLLDDRETGFFKAVRNTNSSPFVLTVTIQAPANGSNVQ